jgi:hypothetical protein
VTQPLTNEDRLARLRHALSELLRAEEARERLAAGFVGMGHNILVESAGKLRYATMRAKAILADEDQRFEL